jgi:hypothetical protein
MTIIRVVHMVIVDGSETYEKDGAADKGMGPLRTTENLLGAE